MYTTLSSDPLIDEILSRYRSDLGIHYDLYRNHVYRVYYLTLLFDVDDSFDRRALAIAAAFHDIGIWTAGTFDYLGPSIDLADRFATETDSEGSRSLISTIIGNHHKLTSYMAERTVESFRRADLIDLSMALVTFGLDRKLITEVGQQFPSLGFRRFILRQALKRFLRHPLSPLPMMRF
jgi:hypothetical protein